MLGELKKKPNNITGLRSLIGLVGCFRLAIPNLCQIAKPLYDILKNFIIRSYQTISWTDEHQSSLDYLLIHVTSPPVLAFTDFSLLFILHTNGSILRCALYQIQEHEFRVLGCSSRTLVAAENKYHSSKLEFLAIRWANCEHLRGINSFTHHIYIDFSPITHLFISAKANATSQGWVVELSNFDFSTHYKLGIENVIGDSFSRYSLL